MFWISPMLVMQLLEVERSPARLSRRFFEAKFFAGVVANDRAAERYCRRP